MSSQPHRVPLFGRGLKAWCYGLPMVERVQIGDAILYRADCREVLPTLDSVGAIITDPPFEQEAHTLQRRQLGKGRENGDRKIIEAPLPFDCITDELRD